MKPDILFLNVEFPVPTNNGGKIAVMGFLEALCEIGNLTVLTFGEGDLETHKGELKHELPSIKNIHIVPHKIHIRRDIRAMLGVARLMLMQRLPYFAAKFVSGQFSTTLGTLLSEKEFGHIIVCHDTRLGAYLPMLRKFAPRAAIESIVIDIETNVISDFIKQQPSALINRLALIEQRRCARFEQRVRDDLDHIFCLSMSDMEQIKCEGPHRSVSYLPTSIKPVRKPGITTTSVAPEGITVLMVSDFSWQPNAEAAQWMLNQVVPHLWAMRSDARILLVGKGSAEIASRLGEDRVKGLGFVDDLGKLYQVATAVAVPVLSTSGIRIKLLDAMRSAVPIVSTETAARAVGAVDGKHLMASNNPRKFAEKIVEISASPALATRLRESAFGFIQENHSIPKICAEFEKYIGLLESGSMARSTAADAQISCP